MGVDDKLSAWTEIFGSLSVPVKTAILQAMPPALPCPAPFNLKGAVFFLFKAYLGAGADWEYQSLIRVGLLKEIEVEEDGVQQTVLCIDSLAYASLVADGGTSALLARESPDKAVRLAYARLGFPIEG